MLPDRAPGASRSASQPATFTVTLAPADPITDTQRSLLGAVVKKVLRVIAFDLIDKLAGEVGDYFVRRWEEHARPHRLRVYVNEATRSWLGTRPAGGVPPAPLTLSVRHASLENASNVVVVGHYVDTLQPPAFAAM